MSPNGICGRQRSRHRRCIVDTQSEVHFGVGVGLVTADSDHRGSLMVFRRTIDENVIEIQVPAVVADALENDETIVIGAIESEGVFVPVVHIGDNGVLIGATVDGAEQLSAFRTRHSVVIHIDMVVLIDVRVAVTEHPEADDIVMFVQVHFGRYQFGRASRRIRIGVESSHILAAFMWRRTWCGAFRDAVEGVIAVGDVVLPTERHEVVLKTFLKRKVGIWRQSRDSKVGILCRSRMAGNHIEGGVDNFVVVQVHRQCRLGH